MEFQFISVGSVRLHTCMAGPVDGKPVIFLHGFPDGWFLFERQIKTLAEAGYRVIAPDQRGYNLSDKPTRIKDYVVSNLVEDVIGLADVLGLHKFSLVGHDWGALVSWMVALQHGDRLEKLVIMNVPHPLVFEKFIGRDLEQSLKSWYFLFFLLPKLPEFMLGFNDFRSMRQKLPWLCEESSDKHLSAWRQPGALTGMLNWYRAVLLYREALPPDGRISTPTLIIWGRKDPYLRWEMASQSRAFCSSVKLDFFDDAGHWVMLEEADRVSELLIDHLKTSSL